MEEWGRFTKLLKYKKKEKLREQMHSDEYLLLKWNSAETILGNKITCRVDGDLVEFFLNSMAYMEFLIETIKKSKA